MLVLEVDCECINDLVILLVWCEVWIVVDLFVYI